MFGVAHGRLVFGCRGVIDALERRIARKLLDRLARGGTPAGYNHSFYCSPAMDAAQRDALRSYDEPARLTRVNSPRIVRDCTPR